MNLRITYIMFNQVTSEIVIYSSLKHELILYIDYPEYVHATGYDNFPPVSVLKSRWQSHYYHSK